MLNTCERYVTMDPHSFPIELLLTECARQQPSRRKGWARQDPQDQATPKMQTIAIDMLQVGNEYILHADLPGYSKESIDISFVEKHHAIKITAKKDLERMVEGFKELISERGMEVERERMVPLPKDAVCANARACHNNGVLTLTIPIRQPVCYSIAIQ